MPGVRRIQPRRSPFTRPFVIVLSAALLVSALLHATPVARAAKLPTPASLQPAGRVNFDPARGTIEALMLFVDFSTLPHGVQTTEATAENLLGGNRFNQFIHQQSGGKLDIRVAISSGWRRMPQPIEAYKTSFEGAFINNSALLRYIKDVQNLYPDVDLGYYPIVYVVMPNSEIYRRSQTANYGDLKAWIDSRRSGDSLGDMRNIVIMGGSAQSQHRPYMSLAHETMHVFGLPDLYKNRPGKAFEIIWDLMGDPYRANGFIGWHHYVLGWLPATRIAVPASATKTEYLLTPIHSGAGTSLLLIPMGKAGKYLAVEIAEPVKPHELIEGTSPWGGGVLAYTVSLLNSHARWQIDLYPPPGTHQSAAQGLQGNVLADAQFTLPHQVGAIIREPISHTSIEIKSRVGSAYRIEVERQ